MLSRVGTGAVFEQIEPATTLIGAIPPDKIVEFPLTRLLARERPDTGRFEVRGTNSLHHIFKQSTMTGASALVSLHVDASTLYPGGGVARIGSCLTDPTCYPGTGKQQR